MVDTTIPCSKLKVPAHSAGAGCIMEALSLRKPLVVVINELLMDNHQTELARRLNSDGHLVYTTPKYVHNPYVSLLVAKQLPSVSTATSMALSARWMLPPWGSLKAELPRRLVAL